MDKAMIELLARRAGLAKALAEFPDDVTAAATQAANVVEKIVAGKMEKYYSEFVLLEQPFVKNPDQTISQLIAERVAKIGENIQVRRFSRFKLGEGIEKRQDDFAAEVAKQAGL